jgi:glutaryl-CoA dehydrogenase
MGVYRNAISYASSREQFGQPISGFQLVQYKLVKIMANTQALGMICWRLADMHSRGEVTIGMIGMFKAFST